MDGERPMFQQSVIPRQLGRLSWRRALGWGSILGDFTLATLLPWWRLGYLILPSWLLLAATRGVAGNSGNSSQPTVELK
jgi:hypothetical protein